MTNLDDNGVVPRPTYCSIHQHYKWCEHNGGVQGLTGYEAVPSPRGRAEERLAQIKAQLSAEWRLKAEQGIDHDHLSDLAFLLVEVEYAEAEYAALLAHVRELEQQLDRIHKSAKILRLEDALRSTESPLQERLRKFELLAAANIRAYKAEATVRELEQARDKLADAGEMLWVVLANVSGGDWTQQSAEWREAAARWRDNYFAALEARDAAPFTDRNGHIPKDGAL